MVQNHSWHTLGLFHNVSPWQSQILRSQFRLAVTHSHIAIIYLWSWSITLIPQIANAKQWSLLSCMALTRQGSTVCQWIKGIIALASYDLLQTKSKQLARRRILRILSRAYDSRHAHSLIRPLTCNATVLSQSTLMAISLRLLKQTLVLEPMRHFIWSFLICYPAQLLDTHLTILVSSAYPSTWARTVDLVRSGTKAAHSCASPQCEVRLLSFLGIPSNEQ